MSDPYEGTGARRGGHVRVRARAPSRAQCRRAALIPFQASICSAVHLPNRCVSSITVSTPFTTDQTHLICAPAAAPLRQLTPSTPLTHPPASHVTLSLDQCHETLSLQQQVTCHSASTSVQTIRIKSALKRRPPVEARQDLFLPAIPVKIRSGAGIPGKCISPEPHYVLPAADPVSETWYLAFLSRNLCLLCAAALEVKDKLLGHLEFFDNNGHNVILDVALNFYLLPAIAVFQPPDGLGCRTVR